MFHKLRYRQVHLDFHTSPHITGIGDDFDREHWQKTLRSGQIDSVTLFATCHHGYAYFDTAVGERHPHLAFDLLREQFDATKQIGINAPIYLTAGVNNWAAHHHPEWREIDADGRYAGWTSRVTDAGFHSMCFNTPYLDLLCQQVTEVTQKFPNCDGIFLDIVVQGECCCKWCLASMESAGLDAEVTSDRRRHAQTVLREYYRATTAAVRANNPGMPVFHNSGHVSKGQTDILKFFSHLELESLPTGEWGYDHFPLSARYVAKLPHDALGMTGKFHTTWGEFGGFKHPNALRYECATMLAHGTKCSIGDQLHPSGRLDESTYELIAAAYKEVKSKESFCEDAVNIADIGLLSSAAMTPEHGRVSPADTGAARLLLEGHFLFDVLDAGMDLTPYKLVILPDDIAVDETLNAKLDAYVAQGGRLLLTGVSGLDEDRTNSAFDIGASLHGLSPFEPDYMLPRPECRPDFCASPMVMYGKSVRLKVLAGTSLGQIYDPYFNRSFKHFCSHQHAPCRNEPSGYDMGVTHGNVTYLAHPVFTIYAGYGSVTCRQVITKVIDRILGESRTLRTNLPSAARSLLTHQPHANRYVLHLLYAQRMLRGGLAEHSLDSKADSQAIEVIEELVPLHNVIVELRNLPRITHAESATSGREVSVETDDDRLCMEIDEVSCHEMIVLNHAHNL